MDVLWEGQTRIISIEIVPVKEDVQELQFATSGDDKIQWFKLSQGEVQELTEDQTNALGREVTMETVQRPRNVAILIFDGVEVLDFCGPLEVFSTASDRGLYFDVYTVAEQRRSIQAINNLNVNPSYSIRDCPTPDILIVPGGWGARSEMNNSTLTDWINAMYKHSQLTLSVCTGALILAKAGLLEGLKITTHHRAFDELRRLKSLKELDTWITEKLSYPPVFLQALICLCMLSVNCWAKSKRWKQQSEWSINGDYSQCSRLKTRIN